MCDYFSAVLLKSGTVLYDESNSHSKILSNNNIRDDGIFGEFLLFEIKQKQGKSECAEPTEENWELLFQSMGGANTFKIPHWYKDSFDKRIWSFFADIQKGRIAKRKEAEEAEKKRLESERAEKEKKETERRKELAERLKINEFKIVFGDDILKNSVNVIKGLINEGHVEITTDGIRIIDMDPANVAMVILDIPSSCALEYTIKDKCEFNINLSNLYQVLKNMTNKDIVTIENNKEEPDKINIILKGESHRTYNLPVCEVGNVSKIPELSMESEVTMLSRQFASQINEANTVAESVSFITKKHSFTMVAEGDLTKCNILNKEGDNIRIVNKKDNEAKYSIEYLMKFADAKIISNEVKLEFKDDYPLRVTYEVIDRVKLMFILAPRVTND